MMVQIFANWESVDSQDAAEVRLNENPKEVLKSLNDDATGRVTNSAFKSECDCTRTGTNTALRNGTIDSPDYCIDYV